MEENNVQTKLHEKKWFLPVLFVVIILSNIIGVATTSTEKAEKIN